MSHIEDRIVQNSREHWVLYVLEGFDRLKRRAVDAEELYEQTGEKFPDAEYVRETLDELCRRHLVSYINGQYHLHSNGSVALKAKRKPENAPWLRESNRMDDDRTEHDRDVVFADLFQTGFRNVYTDDGTDGLVGNEHSNVTPSIYRDAADLAAALEPYGDYLVYVRAGPYRPHDVAYALHTEGEEYVILDYYSVRPGHQYIENVINEVASEAAEQAKWDNPEEGDDE